METKQKLLDELKEEIVDIDYEKREITVMCSFKPIRSCDNIVMNIVINNSEVEKCKNGN